MRIREVWMGAILLGFLAAFVLPSKPRRLVPPWRR